MAIKDIVNGHVNEVLGRNEQLAKTRMEICKACPLYKQGQLGPVCNSNLWLNLETGETSPTQKENFKRGCGCRLNAKTRLMDTHCPLNKW